MASNIRATYGKAPGTAEFDEAEDGHQESAEENWGGKANGKGGYGKGKDFGKAMMMAKAMWGNPWDMWGGKGDMWGGKGGDSAWGGKGKGKGAAPAMDVVPGLEESIRETFATTSEENQSQITDDVVWKVYKVIDQAAKKISYDDRVQQRGTPILARSILEEYVEGAMGSLTGKECYQEANFAAPLTLAALYHMKGCRLFVRTLAPMVQRYTEDAVFRFREEERVQKTIWSALEMSGLANTHWKKTFKHLNAAYDESHLDAKYGAHTVEPPELGFLQDFVYSFMENFVGRAWDVLENGVGSRDEQVIFVTALFQVMTHPEKACFPNDLTIGIPAEHLPPANWPFIAEAATNVWAEMDAAALRPKKEKKWSGGRGGAANGGAPGFGANGFGQMPGMPGLAAGW